jgi:HlyD family secretion protein
MSTTTRSLALTVLLVAACRDGGDTLRVSGTVEIRELQLAPLAAGRLVRLLKDEGDTVQRGDTIAVLDQPGLDALINQRRAQAQAAGLRTAEIAAAEADSQRAANDLRRAGPLRQSDVISVQQYENLQAAAAAAAARLQAVRAATRDSAAAHAGVLATEAIRDQLTVVAPDDGIVLTRFADPGEAVAAGMPVVSLGLVRRPWVRAYVGDRYVARIKVGQSASVRPDGSDRAFSGRIVEISPRAEFTPRAALTERERADLVFGIKVEPDSGDAGGRVKAGMPVTVEISLLP